MASAEQGRRVVVVIIVVMFAITVGVILVNLAAGSTEHLPRQLARLVVTALLAFFLYRGASAARWLAVVGWTLGGLVSVFSAAVGSGLPLHSRGMFASMGAVYLVLAGLLSFQPSVRAHFARRGGPMRAPLESID